MEAVSLASLYIWSGVIVKKNSHLCENNRRLMLGRGAIWVRSVGRSGRTQRGTSRGGRCESGSVMVSGRLLPQGCASRHLRVAVVQEQLKATLVHALRLAERERLADEPAQALAERVVEPLDVVGLAAALAEGNVLALRRCLLGRLPEVGESQRMTQDGRHPLPEQATGLLALVVDGAFQVCQCSRRRSGASGWLFLSRPLRAIALAVIGIGAVADDVLALAVAAERARGGAVTGQGVFLPVRLMRTKPPTSIRMPTMLIRVPTAL